MGRLRLERLRLEGRARPGLAGAQAAAPATPLPATSSPRGGGFAVGTCATLVTLTELSGSKPADT